MDSGNHHIKKYLDYHEKYKEKYGENTVVLMQTGSHFNIFAILIALSGLISLVLWDQRLIVTLFFFNSRANSACDIPLSFNSFFN